MTKQASLRSRLISSVGVNSKLLMISINNACTSRSANLQPIQVLTPPANVRLRIYVSFFFGVICLRRLQVPVNAQSRALLLSGVSEPSVRVEDMRIFSENFFVPRHRVKTRNLR